MNASQKCEILFFYKFHTEKISTAKNIKPAKIVSKVFYPRITKKTGCSKYLLWELFFMKAPKKKLQERRRRRRPRKKTKQKIEA